MTPAASALLQLSSLSVVACCLGNHPAVALNRGGVAYDEGPKVVRDPIREAESRRQQTDADFYSPLDLWAEKAFTSFPNVYFV